MFQPINRNTMLELFTQKESIEIIKTEIINIFLSYQYHPQEMMIFYKLPRKYCYDDIIVVLTYNLHLILEI